jgi:hypothetical protein
VNIFTKLFFKIEKIVEDLLWILPILLLGILTGHTVIALLTTIIGG